MVAVENNHWNCLPCGEELITIPNWLKDLNQDAPTMKLREEAPKKLVVPSLPPSKKSLRQKRQDELMNALDSLAGTGLKKKPLIAKLREQFPKLSSSQICRFINNQLKLRVIEIDRKFKTKPLIIKGKLWGTP